MEIQDYLQFTLPIVILELFAAIAGTYYLRKIPAINSAPKLLVSFLWFTFFIEIAGSYSPIAYFSDYEYFSFVKDTPFRRNSWLYNIYTIISAVFFVYYFSFYINSKIYKKVLLILSVLFVVTSIVNLALTDVFFKFESQYINLAGTFLMILSIILFFFQLLKSDHILNLKRFLPIYVAIAVLIFYLCVTPISIFSEYFKTSTGNILFVDLHVHFLLYSNIFMYSFFILGFIICSRAKKYSTKKKSS